MPEPADDRCPRCGGTFHCGANDAAPCPCTGVSLDAATLRQVRESFDGCLCLRCLHALAGSGAPADPPSAR
jgi:hypothetical protein